MQVVVCVKQVPDTTEVRIDPTTHTLVREGVAAILNPFDAFALEEALRLRARYGGTVTALTMGPPQAEAVLREAIGLGADRAVLLSDRDFAGADTWATSLTLATAVTRLGADLCLCGKQAIDGDTAQVGPGIAAHRGWPQACYVARVVAATAPVEGLPGSLTVERLLEQGRETLRLPLPAVLTVVKEINLPRVATLAGAIRARDAAIPVWNRAELGLDAAMVGLAGSPTAVQRVFAPPARARGERIVADTASGAARELLARLRAAGALG